MLSRHAQANQTYLAEHVSRYDPTTIDQLRLLGGRLGSENAALGVLSQRTSLQALTRAFNEGFMTLVVVFAVAGILVFLLKRPSAETAPAAAH